ncbi:MAG TPA: YqjK family protein [Rubrivivax sp.]|mgnify:CR=1 FL=1|nr:YqjK family protein [Rubrivivax sp.]
MSDDTREELLRRRERLLLRSSLLRDDWSRQVQALRAPLGVADQARAGAQWLLQHPEWPIGAALVVLVLRPGRTLRWVSLALQGYGVYRRVQRLMAKPVR